MNEAGALPINNAEATARYKVLREEWEAAAREFKVASDNFSITVRNLREEDLGDLGNLV
jgi:hypothetical protein